MTAPHARFLAAHDPFGEILHGITAKVDESDGT